MTSLDIAERRKPQDGRARLQVDNQRHRRPRVSTLPSLHGEKVVIRLLARGDNVPPLGKIGMEAHQLETLLGRPRSRRRASILITGPTGSGKTNTLYSAIQQIRSAATATSSPSRTRSRCSSPASPRCRSTSAPA